MFGILKFGIGTIASVGGGAIAAHLIKSGAALASTNQVMRVCVIIGGAGLCGAAGKASSNYIGGLIDDAETFYNWMFNKEEKKDVCCNSNM